MAPGPGEVELRLRACGLCGTDLFKLANDGVSDGAVLGHELVGIVERCGDGVEEFGPGDRVVVPHHVSCGDCHLCRAGSETKCEVFLENLLEPGGFAEFLLVRPRAVELAMWRVPETISDAAAVFLEPAACVLRGVERSGLLGDGAAVVVGGGSMGLLHLLVLRAVHPASRVIVVDPIAERREIAASLGAADTADPSTVEDVVSRAAPDGVDAVFDTVGGAGILDSALGLTRPGGTVVLFAHAGDGETATFDLNRFFKAERRVVATYSGALAEQGRIGELIADGRLDASPLVTHTLPFEAFSEAVDSVRSCRALKVLLVPGEPSAACD